MDGTRLSKQDDDVEKWLTSEILRLNHWAVNGQLRHLHGHGLALEFGVTHKAVQETEEAVPFPTWIK